jgi:hypothetical protein
MTGSLDGKQEPWTGYFHVIPIAEHLKKADRKAAKKPVVSDDKPAASAKE